MPNGIFLHPLLRYLYPVAANGPYCSMVWDLRDPPSFSVRHISSPERRISTFELSQHATNPPLPYFSIICDVLPYQWPIIAYNERGVTIFDVLQAIWAVARRPLREEEWAGLSDKQRDRIAIVYDARWRASAYPEWERVNGLIRGDCLLGYTQFSGMSLVRSETGHVFILTLSRHRPRV